MSLIITFMFEPAKLQKNCASARGTRMRRSAVRDAPSERASVASAGSRPERVADGRRLSTTSACSGKCPYERRCSRVVEVVVEPDRGDDEREMGEGLREVADLASRG